MQHATTTIEQVFGEEYGRLIASLVRRFGDIDIAEDAAGEALVVALEKWPETGVPPNPGGWLTTTAGNRAIDRLRREKKRDVKQQAAFMQYDDTPHEPTGTVEDERLRLLFTCCHPALAPEARIALTLRLLGGLTVAESLRRSSSRRPPWRNGSPGRRRRSQRPRCPTGCRGPPTCRCDSTAYWLCCSSSSTRATSRAATATRCAPSSPARPFAWRASFAGCSPACLR